MATAPSDAGKADPVRPELDPGLLSTGPLMYRPVRLGAAPAGACARPCVSRRPAITAARAVRLRAGRAARPLFFDHEVEVQRSLAADFFGPQPEFASDQLPAVAQAIHLRIAVGA